MGSALPLVAPSSSSRLILRRLPRRINPHRQHRRLGTLTVNVRLLAGDRNVRILERFVNRALLATLVVALAGLRPAHRRNLRPDAGPTRRHRIPSVRS